MLGTDHILNLFRAAARNPAALSAGANLSNYIDTRNTEGPITIVVIVGALGGNEVDISDIRIADDASGTNSKSVLAKARYASGESANITVDGTILLAEISTEDQPFVAVELTPDAGTPIASVTLIGQRER